MKRTRMLVISLAVLAVLLAVAGSAEAKPGPTERVGSAAAEAPALRGRRCRPQWALFASSPSRSCLLRTMQSV